MTSNKVFNTIIPVFLLVVLLYGCNPVQKNHLSSDGSSDNKYYLDYNILEHMEDGMDDLAILEFYKQDIEDVERLSNTKLIIRYFDVDLNDDGRDDKIVILSSVLHSGSHGDSFRILINDEDGYIENYNSLTVCLFFHDSEKAFVPYGSVRVLTHKSESFHSLEIEFENFGEKKTYYWVYEDGRYEYKKT